jgi:DNA-binding NarL/FixJ family response regulator
MSAPGPYGGGHQIGVFLVSDLQLLIEGLGYLLRNSSVRLLGSGAYSPEVLRSIVETEPDLVVVDASSSAGLLFALELAESNLRFPVIAVGVATAVADLLAPNRPMTFDYTRRDASLEELQATILTRLRRHPDGPTRNSNPLEAGVSNPSAKGATSSVLSPREVEVLYCLSQGLSNKEISHRLRIRLYTVKNHVHNLLTKLDVHSRAEAAAFTRWHPGHAAAAGGDDPAHA